MDAVSVKLQRKLQPGKKNAHYRPGVKCIPQTTDLLHIYYIILHIFDPLYENMSYETWQFG